MLKKFRKAKEKGRDFAALLTDLSKPFDSLPHDLFIAKIHACGFDMPLLKLMNSYLTQKTQKIKNK